MNKILALLIGFAFPALISYAQQDTLNDPFSNKAKVEPLVIVSGIETGSYFQLAQDISKNIDIPITIRTSKGSIDNYNILLNDPSADIVFMQYDVLLKAKMYDISNQTNNASTVKILMPLAPEEIHLITKLNSKIYTLQDLKGKKVAVGIPAVQGTYVTAGLIKSVCGISWTDVEIGFDSGFAALLNDQIDAMFFVGYVPVKKFNDLLPTFNQLIRMVSIKDERLSQFHVKCSIKAGDYPWLPYDVETFGVRSVLVTNTKYESPADAERLRLFLTEMQNALPDLQKTANPKWKQVNFDFKTINWDIHPVAKQVFGL